MAKARVIDLKSVKNTLKEMNSDKGKLGLSLLKCVKENIVLKEQIQH